MIEIDCVGDDPGNNFILQRQVYRDISEDTSRENKIKIKNSGRDCSFIGKGNRAVFLRCRNSYIACGSCIAVAVIFALRQVLSEAIGDGAPHRTLKMLAFLRKRRPDESVNKNNLKCFYHYMNIYNKSG